MRKNIIFFTGAIIAAAVLAGCGADVDPKENETTEISTVTKAPVETTTSVTETTTVQSATIETTVASGELSKAETPVYDNDNPPEEYKKKINKYLEESKTQCDENGCLGFLKSFPAAGRSMKKDESLYYSVHDINGDGIPELMIFERPGNSYSMLKLNTLSKGNVIGLIEGGYRLPLSVDSEGYIYNGTTGGATYNDEYKYILPKRGTSLSLVEKWSQRDSECTKNIPLEGYDPVNAPDKMHTEAVSDEEYLDYAKSFIDSANDCSAFDIVPLRHFELGSSPDAHPEDDDIMEHLREFYSCHKLVDGVPADTQNPDYPVKYEKYAIADFDGDGVNELMIQTGFDYFDTIAHNLFMYDHDQTIGYNESRILAFHPFSDVTFSDNGIAYYYADADAGWTGNAIDGKNYYILSDKKLEELNYNLNNFHEGASTFILIYKKEDGKIKKYLNGGSEWYFEPAIKTQEQYDNDMSILNSGHVMDIDIKDFTAENIGL